MDEIPEAMIAIYCQTGCSCCSGEYNHYRGFYKTAEDAERRIKYYQSEDSKFWPVASQFASRGRYTIQLYSIETLPDGRVIINDERVLQANELKIIEVHEDGTIDDDNAEELGFEP